MPAAQDGRAPPPITVFHNPDCGTSRTVLALLRDAGHAPTVVEYLRTGWSRAQLERLLAAMGTRPLALLRRKETLAAALGLLGPDVTDAGVLDAMLAHPVLVERPIVCTALGTVLARPPERVWDVLPTRPA